jgi:hypothetical protein
MEWSMVVWQVLWFIVELQIGDWVFRGDARSVDFWGCGEAGSSGLIRFDKCDTRFTPENARDLSPISEDEVIEEDNVL